jgi:hypothetical protein
MKPQFQIHFDRWPAVAVGPNAIFGSYHVTKDFTTAHVTTASGDAYNPGGQQFFRHARADGTQGEEAVYDFNFKYRVQIPDGGEMCFTHREIPSECVVKSFFRPEVGKVLHIDALVSGPSVARVVAFGPGYIQTDWTPQNGDSGSLCWGEDESFAGAVTRRAHGMPGGIISTPPQVGDPMLEGTVPYAPGTWPGSTGPAPTPTPAPEPPPAPTPVAAPPAPVATPATPPLSSGPITQPAQPKPAAALPSTFLVAGSSVFAIRADGALFRLSSLANLWEQMPELPSK